jgi:hypothetical protein
MLRENNTRTGFLEDSQYEKLVEDAELWFRTLVKSDPPLAGAMRS